MAKSTSANQEKITALENRVAFLEETVTMIREDLIEQVDIDTKTVSHLVDLEERLQRGSLRRGNSSSNPRGKVEKSRESVSLDASSGVLHVEYRVESGEISGVNPPGEEDPCNVPTQTTPFPQTFPQPELPGP